jgi:hypothetical protein
MPLEFFQWCERTWIGRGISDSVWLFGVIEAVHLLGLCLLGGAVIVLDLRLLGLGLTAQPIAEVARSAKRWLVTGIVVMAATGIPLFLSEAVKCYYNQSFWVKITTLPLALLYAFALRQPIASNPALVTSVKSRLVAVGSLGLWFTVAAAGRWIGFSS